MRVYIESTIPSYLSAQPARDALQARRQRLTQDWWALERPKHDLFVSFLVLQEIAQGEPTMTAKRAAIVAGVSALTLTSEAQRLAEKIVSTGILPAIAEADALHIALATAHKMDILLTWNIRHISNAAIQHRLDRLVRTSDLELPLICSPENLWRSDL